MILRAAERLRVSDAIVVRDKPCSLQIRRIDEEGGVVFVVTACGAQPTAGGFGVPSLYEVQLRLLRGDLVEVDVPQRVP